MTYQKTTGLELSEPLLAVEVQALVYGERTAKGSAGPLAGEYDGVKLSFESVVLP